MRCVDLLDFRENWPDCSSDINAQFSLGTLNPHAIIAFNTDAAPQFF